MKKECWILAAILFVHGCQSQEKVGEDIKAEQSSELNKEKPEFFNCDRKLKKLMDIPML